jgi:hypothetical protein
MMKRSRWCAGVRCSCWISRSVDGSVSGFVSWGIYPASPALFMEATSWHTEVFDPGMGNG